MGANTKISWTDHTFNPWWGCTEVGPGCDNCYAREWAARFGTKWGHDAPRRFFDDKHWNEPLKWNRNAEKTGEEWRVFCASMADWADNEVEPVHRDRLWALIREAKYLTWLLLTKRVGNAKKMLPPDWRDGYPHVWFGITVVNQEEADRDIPKLAEIPARIRWLSVEPCLGPILIRKEWPIDWAVVGGESGDKRREMELGWLEKIVAQSRVRNIPVWVKQDSARQPGMQGRISAAWWIHEFPKIRRG
jgi:protein gp37